MKIKFAMIENYRHSIHYHSITQTGATPVIAVKPHHTFPSHSSCTPNNNKNHTAILLTARQDGIAFHSDCCCAQASGIGIVVPELRKQMNT